ncbi:MAG: DUF1385 domain-containing protein [Actinobacteria bacterium]|nr:DUF1385 domain-containing protein [Actinomycetota bacterium]MBE3113998.1 DUF1385 domain-containing protein [Actinomycetota bacterium]
MSEANERYQVGGQAVIEGVMMRSKHFWALAVRKPDKTIYTKLFNDVSLTNKNKVLGFMFIRGIIALIESMTLGFKALSYSINEATEEEIKFSKREMTISVIIAVVFAVGVFFILPTIIGRSFSEFFPNAIVYNLLEGLIRIGFFFAYILLVSQIKDIKRVFQYHGAEHKTIQAYENDEELKPENVRKYSTMHVRCGTSFLLIVMIVALLIFALLGKQPMIWRIISRILLIPVIAGISYELIRLAGKFSKYKVVNILFYPGLLLQKITTKEPDNDQIEVAISSFKKVIEAEKALKAG